MPDTPVRVRYAPSPTGAPHIGNIRTALFNWLFARHGGGSFVVRIEDTDVERKVPGALEEILDSLRWLNLDWDEGPEVGGSFGPYLQSQRLPLYKEMAERLVAQGDAYVCYCSPERLDEMRREQIQRKEPPRYDRRCRFLSAYERAELETQGLRSVVRFAIPLEGETTFHDLLRGDITYQNAVLDDFVLLKSDGYPTYHLANVTDDHLMQITHVMRAEEWIPSTPRHVLLYRALGFEPPLFAHMPMILGPDRSKLSKRHGATSLAAYREQGYLPEAIFNFLALLGWSYDERAEILSREEVVRSFTLERVGKTAAIFNIEKLDWMNGVYIRQLSVDQLADRLMPFLEAGLPPEAPRPLSREFVEKVVPLIQERLKKLDEAADLTSFLFVEKIRYDPHLLIGKNMTAAEALHALRISREKLAQSGSFDAAHLESIFRPLAEELKLKPGQLFGILRVATTGRTIAPPLFQTMEVLGRERCSRRIEEALTLLEPLAAG
ncbi:MAG: glutamate--tRNA ligase [Chloroflexota bacterium]|nr:MAG: glutamate--tRNA ligase [Chloroflexota bacterium]